VGGYDDWIRQRSSDASEAKPAVAPKVAKAKSKAKPTKLSYKDQRELDALPKRIEELDAELATAHATVADPEFYQQDGATIAEANKRLQQLEQELEQAYARWEELESSSAG
jgi:ATP-binding cassette subfamily F protein uup